MNERPLLKSPLLLARKPWIGWAMFLTGITIFILLALNLVLKGPLLPFDKAVSDSWHQVAVEVSPTMRALTRGGWYLGNEVAVVVALIMGIYFIVKRFWMEFWMTVAGGVGAPLFFLATSHTFNRARPEFAIPIEPVVTQPSFPSGHAVIGVAVYGLLAYFLIQHNRSAFAKTAVILMAFAFILFIGFSRIFTGGHYPTDVLAGYALGLAWSGVAYTTIEVHYARRAELRL